VSYDACSPTAINGSAPAFSACLAGDRRGESQHVFCNVTLTRQTLAASQPSARPASWGSTPRFHPEMTSCATRAVGYQATMTFPRIALALPQRARGSPAAVYMAQGARPTAIDQGTTTS
jgi:hypothetical protein